MAGPTTARRGAGKPASAGPPRPGRQQPPRWRRRIRRLRPPMPGRRTVLVVAAVLTLLSAGGVWVLYGSTWLRVEKVAVTGTRVLTPRQVAAGARVPMRIPLASVDTGAVAARLRAELPRIDSVTVTRAWPNEIVLKVTERKPEVLIEKGGKFIEVDGKSVRFSTVSQAPKGVPLLELDAAGSPSLRRFGTERLQREGVGVAAGLPEGIRRETRTVRVSSYDSITLELTGGRTVMWGSGEQGPTKAKVLLALMKTARGADHFDVSAPSAPASSGS